MDCVCGEGHDPDMHEFEEFGDERDGCGVALCPCEGYAPDIAGEVERIAG